MISALQHPNLVKLYGCCTEGKQRLLVYEYMENKSLATALFGPEEKRLKLNWPTRHKICIGIARGLAYLHEESTLKIVHRDIKSTNVLLDKDLNAKISDFGLAKLHEDEKSHISTRIAGTYFGVVALEIVSGQNNMSCKHLEEGAHLLDWACILQQRGNLLDLVDPVLDSAYSKEALIMLNVALLCTISSSTFRPKMSTVVGMLEGREPVQAPHPSPAVSTTHSSSRMQSVADRQCSTLVHASSRSTEMSWTGYYGSGPAQESEHVLRCLLEIRPSAEAKFCEEDV